jgi:adenylate cyclase
MNFRERPAVVWALPLAALALGLTLLATDLGHVATKLRFALFDAYERNAPRAYQDTNGVSPMHVRVLAADADSLSRFGPWPWPHAVLAKLTGELHAQGASDVVFDFPLSVPDSASPKAILAEIPSGTEYDTTRATVAALPSPDDAFATSLQSVNAVTGFELGVVAASRPPHLKTVVSVLGAKDPFKHVPSFQTASGALPEIENASAGIGALNLPRDRDGTLRRMPMLFRTANVVGPSLDAETMRVVSGRSVLTVRSDEGESSLLGGTAGVATIVSEAGELPSAADGSLWISWTGPERARDISAAALDEGRLGANALKNTIIYLGAPDDLVQTPAGDETAAEAHAEAMENILSGSVLRRPASAALAELVCTVILGLALVLMFARLGALWPSVAALVGVTGASFASWYLFRTNHVLLDTAGPAAAIGLVILVGVATRVYELSLSRMKLRSAFADALSGDAVEKIARSPALLKLDGENRTVTYMSCGIRGFSAISSSFRDDPASFTRLMQRVLTPLMDEVLSHGGAIDRLSSDGFTAFWNAPLDDPEHAMHACEAASRMTERMAANNEQITRERRVDGVPLAPVEIGIGISTGPGIAGGFHAHGRTAYSVNGDCVIVANRIQALSGQYGPAVIVAESTRKSSERGFAFLEVDYIATGANDEPIKLYAMLGNPVVRASPKFRALMTFHEHIFQSLRTQQWEKTRDLIDQCRKLSGASQKLYDLHLARVAYFEANPPGAEWDGAFRPILK